MRHLAGELHYLDRRIATADRHVAGDARGLREDRLVAVVGCWMGHRSRAALQVRLERALVALRDDLPDDALDRLADALLPDELRAGRAA